MDRIGSIPWRSSVYSTHLIILASELRGLEDISAEMRRRGGRAATSDRHCDSQVSGSQDRMISDPIGFVQYVVRTRRIMTACGPVRLRRKMTAWPIVTGSRWRGTRGWRRWRAAGSTIGRDVRCRGGGGLSPGPRVRPGESRSLAPAGLGPSPPGTARGGGIQLSARARSPVRLRRGARSTWGRSWRCRAGSTRRSRALRLALSLAPDSAEAHNHLGGILFRLGRPDEAAASLREAVRCDPCHPMAPSALGYLLSMQGRYAEMADVFRSITRIRPDHLVAHLRLGEALVGLGQLEEAKGCFEVAAGLAPDLPEAHLGLGMVLLDLDRPQEAVPGLRRAVELAPDRPESHTMLARRSAPCTGSMRRSTPPTGPCASRPRTRRRTATAAFSSMS